MSLMSDSVNMRKTNMASFSCSQILKFSMIFFQIYIISAILFLIKIKALILKKSFKFVYSESLFFK